MFVRVRQLHVYLVYGLVLVCILCTLLVPLPVWADVGVQPILPGGSSLKPEEATPIQMAAEKVVMTVRPATEADNAAVKLNPEAYGLQLQPVWFPAVTEVEADFTMKNPTGEAVSMVVWFPLASALDTYSWELNPDEIVPRIESFQVAVGGNPVQATVSELPNPKGSDRPTLPWASFPVTFAAGEDTSIHVSYLLPLHPLPKGNELKLDYIFQTGAGWAGPIGQVELVVNLPYPASEGTVGGAPPDAEMEDKQARWLWQDLEPGPEDDFSARLLQPAKWQELEAARRSVQANPQDGQAWLELAQVYYTLATTGYNSQSVFNAAYLPSGIEAFQKAGELLPDHPAPHAGLALLTLSPYMKEKNAPQDVIQYVQDEFSLARELEARNPSLAEEAGISSLMLEDVLSIYFYNDATATAEWAAWSTDWANETATAAAETVLVAPTRTPQVFSTSTPEPLPTTTPFPPTPTIIQPGQTTGNGQSLIIIMAAGVVGLAIVGYLGLKRMRRRASK